jgi:uncharacterized protein
VCEFSYYLVSVRCRERYQLATLRRLVVAILVFFAAGMAMPALAQTAKATGPSFPALTGRVVDQANIIPPDVEAQLNARLAALEAKSSDQLVVVTVPSLQGYEIEEYGYRLGRTWQIGQGERLNNGVILLVAPSERKVRIEVGYGLEGVLTDMFTGEVIRDNIVPAFKAGDMPAGIVAGVDGIEALLTADPAELQARAERGLKEASSAQEIDPVGMIIVIIFIIFWLLAASRSIRSGRSRRHSGWGSGPIIIHDWDNDHRSGGGGGGFFSGGGDFGGGGGFSGGGGSFGGGGSSGSW